MELNNSGKPLFIKYPLTIWCEIRPVLNNTDIIMTGEFSEIHIEGEFALRKWGVSSGMKVSDFSSNIHRNSGCVSQACILFALSLKSQF